MRLYEKVLGKDKIGPSLPHWAAAAPEDRLAECDGPGGHAIDTLADMPHIVADNVAEHMLSESGERMWDVGGLPPSPPPFPRFWVEFRVPGSIWTGGKYQPLVLPMTSVGVFFNANREEDGGWDCMLGFVLGYRNGHAELFSGDVLYNLDRLGNRVRGTGRLSIPFGEYLPADGEKFIQTMVFTYSKIMFGVLAFMNCKNVKLNAVEPDAKLNRARVKRGKQPLVRYHTINIGPLSGLGRSFVGPATTDEAKRALHIARGHFATYTPDRPLFGHFAGTVWKPAHVRGSLKSGAVISDYAVGAPKS